MPDAGQVVRHLMIHGQVQGVAFRASARAEAERLALLGWVRNRADGCVEATVAGPAESVERFVQWAHRGPALARVERVDVSPGEQPDQTGFVMLPTL